MPLPWKWNGRGYQVSVSSSSFSRSFFEAESIDTLPISSVLPSAMAMEPFLPIVNELQLIFKNIGIQEIELPQIVVVGSQSSGKSSVLTSLVRESFLPRGSGVVTRCPIILQLQKVLRKEDDLDSSVVFELLPPKIYSHFADTFTDPSELQAKLESLTNEMAGTNKGIVDTPIVVRVYSPNVVSLTVNPVGDQPPDIEDQVMRMIKRYISNEDALILAVCPANNDSATWESIKFAREVDPDGERTVAVLTKLDLLEKGVTVLRELQGEIIPVKLGLVGVINRSQHDLEKNKSIKESFKDEMEKLTAWYPSLAGRIGSEYLAQRLNDLLLEHIKKCIPNLKVRVNELLMEKLKRKEVLGMELPTTDAEKISLMIELMMGFEQAYKALVERRTDLEKNFDSVGPRISNVTSQFVKELRKVRPFKKCECHLIPFHPLCLCNPGKCACPPRSVVYDYCDTCTLIIGLMKRSTSHEGIISIEDVFKTVVKKQIDKYKDPCKNYVDKFYSILGSTMEPALEHCTRFTILKRTIIIEMKKLLDEALLKLKDELLEEWFNERLIMIYSTDKDFSEILLNGKNLQGANDVNPQNVNQHGGAFPPLNELGGTKKEYVHYVRDLVEAFLSSTSYLLANSWPGKVMYQMYAQTMKTFSTAVRKTIVPKFNEIIVENPQITSDRCRNQEEISSLEEACAVLNRIENHNQPFDF